MLLHIGHSLRPISSAAISLLTCTFSFVPARTNASFSFFTLIFSSQSEAYFAPDHYNREILLFFSSSLYDAFHEEMLFFSWEKYELRKHQKLSYSSDGPGEEPMPLPLRLRVWYHPRRDDIFVKMTFNLNFIN